MPLVQSLDILRQRVANPTFKTVLDSVHDRGRISPAILAGVKPFLDAGAVDVWFWGHEHRCVAYRPFAGLAAARCIGHGGVPELAQLTLIAALRKVVEWVKGIFKAHRVSWVRIEQEYKEIHRGADGRKWHKQGFAILHLDGPSAWATYVDEDGVEHWFDGLGLPASPAADAARAASLAPVKFG